MINEKDFIFDIFANFSFDNQYCERQEVKLGDYNYEIDLSGNVYFKTKYDLYRLDNERIGFKKDELAGFMDNEGVIIVQPKYNHIYTPSYTPNEECECYSFCTADKYKWGLIDGNGNIKVPAIYDGEFEHIGKNYYRAYTMEGDGVIDDNGNVILPFEYYDCLIYFWNEEKDKFTAFKNKIEKVGVVNTKNGVIIPFEYDRIDFCFKSGKYKNCSIANKNGFEGIINKKNEIIIPFEYKDITKLSDETFLVSKDKKSYYIADDKFDKIRDVNFNWTRHYEDITNDYFVVNIEESLEDYFANPDNSYDERYGLIDKYGNLLIDLKYKDLSIISFLNDELYILAQNEQDKYGIIDINENIIVPFEYDCQYGLRIEKDYTVVLVKDKKYGIINVKDNSVIVDFVFDCIESFNDRETTIAKYNGKWGVINKKGEALKFDLKNVKEIL